MRIERETELGCSPEEVFAYVSDPRNDPEWCPKVVSAEPLGEGQVRVGARYRIVHRPQRTRPAMDLDLEIVELDPPHRVALREQDRDGVFEVVYELHPAGPGRTRMRQRSDVTLNGVPRLLHPLARLIIGRHLDGQFRELRRRLGT